MHIPMVFELCSFTVLYSLHLVDCQILQYITLKKVCFKITCRDLALVLSINRTRPGVVGVMNMGNAVPRAGLEPTYLAFRTSVLSLHHVGSLMSPIYLHSPVYVALCLKRQCCLFHSSPWNCKYFNTYNYIHRSNGLTYT